MRYSHLPLALQTCLLATVSTAAFLPAQNLFEAGNFQEGALDWKNTAFNDPAGTFGFGVAPVTTEATSEAVFADFQTLTSVRSATFVSTPFLLPQASHPVTFNVMWDKGTVTTPIPYPSVNRVELRIYDASNTRVFNQQVNVPNQSGAMERATFSNTVVIPATGLYTAELFLRHSNLAGLPFVCWVDDLVIGTPTDFVYHKGCPGTGNVVPEISSSGSPAVASNSFAVNLSKAQPNAVAPLAVGLSHTMMGSVPLPLPLGGGCQLSQSTNVLVFLTASTGGTAQLPIPIPNDQTLKGVKVYFQFAANDAAKPMGFTTTAGMRVTVL